MLIYANEHEQLQKSQKTSVHETSDIALFEYAA